MMKAFAGALALGLMVLGAATAMAHGPSRQKVIEKAEIAVPPDKVWAVIGNFQDMNWHPAVAKTEGTGGNEPGATRKITLKNGGTIEEKLNKYDKDGKSYSYEITNVDVKFFPVNNYSSTISVGDAGGKSVLEWKGACYRGYVNNDPPPELNDEAAVKAMLELYKAGFDAVKAKVGG